MAGSSTSHLSYDLTPAARTAECSPRRASAVAGVASRVLLVELQKLPSLRSTGARESMRERALPTHLKRTDTPHPTPPALARSLALCNSQSAGQYYMTPGTGREAHEVTCGYWTLSVPCISGCSWSNALGLAVCNLAVPCRPSTRLVRAKYPCPARAHQFWLAAATPQRAQDSQLPGLCCAPRTHSIYLCVPLQLSDAHANARVS